MKLRKTGMQALIVLGAVLIAYLVLALAIPFRKTGVYWLAMLFTLIAFAVQVYIFKLSFDKEKTIKSKFYGFPIARIGVVYLGIQIVLSFLFMALAAFCPVWVSVVVQVLVLLGAVVGVVSTDAMRDEIERQDTRLKEQVAPMRALQSRISVLAGQCDNPDLKAAIEKLSESFRYSDPVSGPAVAESEQQLAALMGDLEQAILDHDSTNAKDLARKLEATLAERNRLCKLNK